MQGSNAERAQGATASKNLRAILDQLPAVLSSIPELSSGAKQLQTSADKFYNEIKRILADAADDVDDDVTSQPAKEPSNFGSQANQAEAMINDILNQVPANQRGDIRNAISKSSNRLQALVVELQKRGIKL